MPSIAWFHPEIVHFVVALLFVGVALRIVSLTGRLPFTGPAATLLIIVGTVASLAAVKSGTDAHGPVERVPGARAAVLEHEEWGLRARNVFIIVALVDVAALVLARRKHPYAMRTGVAASVAGLVGLLILSQAAARGGDLVYSYAGGVGIRSGRPEDVERLLVAGVYQQASLDRQAGKGLESMALVDETARRFPDNLELQLMGVEWRIEVRRDPGSAIQRLDSLPIPAADARLRTRAGLLRARALEVGGNMDGARAVLETLRAEYPDNAQIQRRLSELGATQAPGR